MSLRFEWVFFDAVDTLFRTRGPVGAIYARAARRHGVDADPAALEAAFRRALRATPPLAFPAAAPDAIARLERAWWRDLVAQVFAGQGRFAAFDTFFEEIYALFATAAPWELCAGADTVPAELRRAGARLAVVSDMDGRLEEVLRDFGLSREFDAVVLASRSGTRKRGGSLFAHALAVTGAHPRAVAHVGDNVETDVHGARETGITPVHYDPGGRGGTPPGVAVVRSLADLPALLQA